MIDLREPDLAHSVWRLVFLGSLVTWAGATAAAIVLLGLSFEVALLLGAVLVVTPHYRQGLGRSHVFRLCSQDQNPGAVGRQFSRLTQGEFEQAWEQGWRPEVLELQDQHEATSSAAPLFVLREDGSWEVVSSDSAARSRPGDRVLALTPPPNKDLGPDG